VAGSEVSKAQNWVVSSLKGAGSVGQRDGVVLAVASAMLSRVEGTDGPGWSQSTDPGPQLCRLEDVSFPSGMGCPGG
jgi:hypothetical protein